MKNIKNYHSIFVNGFITVIFLLLSSFFSKTQNDFKNNEQIDAVEVTTVTVAGDAMMHMPQITAGYDKERDSYTFSSWFTEIEPILAQSDLNIINLETTLAGKPYKGYPQFSAPNEYARDLHNAGFNFFVLANNHSVDRKGNGIEKTINTMNDYGIPNTGTFKSEAERDSVYPVLLKFNKTRISLLNCTYGTNGLVPPAPYIVNMIDTLQLKKDIETAKADKSDIIMIAIHWGGEYNREPDDYQKKIADFLVRNGVDIIIGSHPHVIQPIEIIEKNNNKCLVIWSLGNFVSNQRRHYTDGGMMVQFDIVKNTSKIKDSYVDNIQYIPFWVYKTPAPVVYKLLPLYKFDQGLSDMTAKDNASLQEFVTDTRTHLEGDDRIIEYTE
jgi:poly-gamma-glutamate capsule biosynthesis protein CapA/YwtB (metallophosphatase superfamily)